MTTIVGPRVAQAMAGARPGQMTVAMRAMPQASGPRVLRVGMIQAGRVVEERVIKQRTHVTIGSGHTNTFVASGAQVPESMRLFELVAGEYVLNLTDAMKGRVALPAGVTDVDVARTSGLAKRVGAHCQLKLGQEARGKVVLGETVFLFQFVAPPLAQPKPQLPLAVRAGLAGQVDWGFTTIASFSFLFHFGFAGAVNSEWFDPTVDEQAEVATFIDSIRDRAVPLPPETKPESADPNAVAKDKPGAKEQPGPKGKPNGPAPKPGPSPASTAGPDPRDVPRSRNEQAADNLSKQADDLTVALLTVTDRDGATRTTLRPGVSVATDAVDKTAADTTGINTSPVALRGQANNAPSVPGVPTGDAIWRGGPRTTSPTTVASTAPVPVGPAIPTPLPQPDPTVVGAVPGADAVVSKNKWRFRACYNIALRADPDAGGAVAITVTINAEGKVTAASGSGGSPASLASCVANSFYQMTFSAPDGGPATFNVKAVFASKK
jgi:hypothetical protein